GLKYARKVFRDGFVRHRDGYVVHVPTVPLARLYGEELRDWLGRHGVSVVENAAVRGLKIEEVRLKIGSPVPVGPQSSITNLQSQISHLVLRDGSTLTADWYVLAVPFDRISDLLPEDLVSREPYFANVKNLTPSPITSVHLWYDRPVMRLPHAVLV